VRQLVEHSIVRLMDATKPTFKREEEVQTKEPNRAIRENTNNLYVTKSVCGQCYSITVTKVVDFDERDKFCSRVEKS